MRASSFKNVSHRAIRKYSRVIVQEHSGQCGVPYLENIEPAMEHSDWLIFLVIDPLNQLSRGVVNVNTKPLFMLLCYFLDTDPNNRKDTNN